MIRAVGLFLLLLLKTAGLALLILLFLLLIALLLVLFIPLRYDVLAKNERSMSSKQKGLTANVQLRLKVNWLLHLLQVSILYGPDGLSNQILVAGIDIPELLARHAEKKKARPNSKKSKKSRHTGKKVKEPDADEESFESPLSEELYAENKNADVITLKDGLSKEESLNKELLLNEDLSKEELQIKEIQIKETQIKETQIKEQSSKMQQKDSPKEQHTDVHSKADRSIENSIEKNKTEKNKTEKNKTEKNKIKKDKIKKEDTEKQKTIKHQTKASASKDFAADTDQTSIFKKIRTQLQRVHKEYTDETNRHAVGRLWVELLKLLRSYKPKKLKADVSFSLADPSLTGTATGLLSLMPVIYRYPCRIVPDFTSEKLYVEGEILAGGKVRIFVFLCSVLRLMRDKQFMQVVRRLMKRGGA